MAAIGAPGIAFVLVQVGVALAVAREAAARRRRGPAVLGVAAFVLGILLAFVTDSVLVAVIIQALVGACYMVVQSSEGSEPSTG